MFGHCLSVHLFLFEVDEMNISFLLTNMTRRVHCDLGVQLLSSSLENTAKLDLDPKYKVAYLYPNSLVHNTGNRSTGPFKVYVVNREARVYLFCLLHAPSSLCKSPLELFLFPFKPDHDCLLHALCSLWWHYIWNSFFFSTPSKITFFALNFIFDYSSFQTKFLVYKFALSFIS